VLIAGHGRVAAAAKLGLKSIPVIVARGWSEEEKQAYRLADNELAARSTRSAGHRPPPASTLSMTLSTSGRRSHPNMPSAINLSQIINIVAMLRCAMVTRSLLDIPIGRPLWVLTDDVHVIELECGVAHLLPLVALPAAGSRDDTLRTCPEIIESTFERVKYGFTTL
jgi:hypothetical protein